MPIPKPNKGEKQDEFISRCMGNDTMVKEYDQKQRAAICYSTWRDAHGGKKPKSEELNLSQTPLAVVATKLVHNKWLLNASVHTQLCKQMNGYMNGSIPLKMDGQPNEHVPSTEEIIGHSHAVIYINGILSSNVSPEAEMLLGLCDTQWISDRLDEGAGDSSVRDIILCWNSPGGETTGIEELGRKIAQIDETIKPIYSFCGNTMDSAAYWLGSQARKIGMIPSAQVGGVGVYLLILDETRKNEMEGVKVNVISSGKYKMLGHEFVELQPEEKEMLQKDVETQHEKFRNVILAKRPEMSVDDMEGLSFNGEDALEKQFVDVLCDSMKEFITNIEQETIYYSNNGKNMTTKPVMQKVKVQPAEKAPKKLSFIEKIKQLMKAEEEEEDGGAGKYDGGYAGNTQPNPDSFIPAKAEEEETAVPGVPGTTQAEEKTTPTVDDTDDDSDDKYAELTKRVERLLEKLESKAEEEEEEETIPDKKMEETKAEEEDGGAGKYDGGYSGGGTATPSITPNKVSEQSKNLKVDMSVFPGLGQRMERKHDKIHEMFMSEYEKVIKEMS